LIIWRKPLDVVSILAFTYQARYEIRLVLRLVRSAAATNRTIVGSHIDRAGTPHRVLDALSLGGGARLGSHQIGRASWPRSADVALPVEVTVAAATQNSKRIARCLSGRA
jgi:hypothetical protein